MHKRLTLEDRKKIEGLVFNNYTRQEICKAVGIHPSTLVREFKKCKEDYRAEEAHRNTCKGYKPIDYEIIGKKFGLLTVLDFVTKHKHRTF